MSMNKRNKNFNRTIEPDSLSIEKAARNRTAVTPFQQARKTVIPVQQVIKLSEFGNGDDQQKQAQMESLKLAYEMYGPVVQFQNENIMKRNLEAFMEKRGSRLGQYPDENNLTDEFNSTRLKLATAGTRNRANYTSLINK